MGDIFFQIFLALLGIVIGILSQVIQDQPRMQRLLLLIFGLLLFLFGGLWAGFNLAAKQPSPTQPSPTVSPGSTSTIEQQTGISGDLTVWYVYFPGSSEEAALKTVINNAEQQYSSLRIEATYIPYGEILSKYRNAVEAGGGPDMFLMPNDDIGGLARSSYIMPLDKYLEGHLDQVFQLAINGMKVDGKIYGIPESSKVLALFYNKTLVPIPPSNTEDLRQLVQSQKAFAAPITSYDLFPFSGGFGDNLFDSHNKCIADQGGWVDMMQYLLDLQKFGAQFVDNREQLDALFESGQVAMVINGPWALVDYKAHLGNQLGVSPIPSGSSGPANPILGVDGFYVNPKSPRGKLAVQVALILTNQQSSQIFTNLGGHVPVRADVTSNDSFIDYFRQAETTALVRPQNAEFTNYWSPFQDMFTNVLKGNISSKEGIATACKLMNQANGK
jgi:maltose-binding protein MalE